MASIVSADRIRFLLNRLRDRLWVRPLGVCLLSVAAVFVAKFADGTSLGEYVPILSAESVNTLLSIMASSMLVIATFAVASMVSAYASASSTATPRSFTLVVADDVSQNALSTFIGSFIFSIVAITASKNHFFGTAGLFTLFVLTVIVFGLVVVTFVHWVDRIARLGRMGSTIAKVERATAGALKRRRARPTFSGLRSSTPPSGRAVYATRVGYVQHIEMTALQAWAAKAQVRVVVAALPGTLAAPGRALAYVDAGLGEQVEMDCGGVVDAFKIGSDRLFDDDPRFGLVVLSEISGRALSPAVNDPGTAIEVVGTLLRLFALWSEPAPTECEPKLEFDRVEVPELSVRDMFDDAFTAMARDGAGTVEVSVRLQKALAALASIGDADLRAAAEHHGRLALKRSELALSVAEDLAAVRDAASFVMPAASSDA